MNHSQFYPTLLALALVVLTAPCVRAQRVPEFPTDFIGNWEGTLHIYGPDTVFMRVPMAIEIQPLTDSSYTHYIIYGEDREKGLRPYELVPGADGPHHWIVDEKNDILLDGYFLGATYHSSFSVQGTYLVSTLEHRGDHLVYAIQSGPEEAVRTTGGTGEGEDAIPEVKSFLTKGFQRAVLRRRAED